MFGGLGGHHVQYSPLYSQSIITHDARALGPGLVVSRANKIFISALFADSIVKNNNNKKNIFLCHLCSIERENPDILNHFSTWTNPYKQENG